jgi:hypothetical protein
LKSASSNPVFRSSVFQTCGLAWVGQASEQARTRTPGLQLHHEALAQPMEVHFDSLMAMNWSQRVYGSEGVWMRG